ncbi:MAG: hypothetical protein IPJ71_06610 [Bdellovibrionales bacterium]|nr:hypothetical protein [Bdellovibrionales bacterium]
MARLKILIFLFLAQAFAISCKKEGDAIVIPPGGQIQFNVDRFLYYSDDLYEVVLRSPTDDNAVLETVLDITPLSADRLVRGKVHSIISPKNMTLTGPYVIQVRMDYHDTELFALVTDQDKIVYPSLQSTLVYQILANYPKKSIKAYSKDQISLLQNYVDKFTRDRLTTFGLNEEMNPDLLYKFYKNGLSNNLEFLNLLASLGAQFNFDSTGEVLTAPFPFGVPNNPPVLDIFTSTPPGLVAGKEQSLLEVNAEATDVDGDMLFYVWKQKGEIILTDTQHFSWTPGSFDGGGDNYGLQVLITDGGRVLTIDWELAIQDFNRKPVISGACLPTVREKSTWSCRLTGVDPDFDNLTWSLNSTGFSSPVKINGIVGPATVTGSAVTLEWTPDNADAKKGSAFVDLRLDDGKQGLALRGINLTVLDVNTPPYILGGGIVPTNPNQSTPIEFDQCLMANPLGTGDFSFDIAVIDPDNEDPTTTPPDTITATVTGNFGSSVTQSAPTVTPSRTTFHFVWRPTHLGKTANFVVVLSDDHGGVVAPQTITLTAADVNQVPCKSGTTPLLTNPVQALSPITAVSAPYTDGDFDPPLIQSINIPTRVLPHLQSCDPGAGLGPVVLKRKAGQAYFLYETKLSTMSQCFSNNEASPYASTVTVQRPGPGSSDITINAGTQFWTDYVASGFRVYYQTAAAVTMESSLDAVVIPLTPLNRTSAANTLKIIENPGLLSVPGVTVTNPSLLNAELGKATFTLPSPAVVPVVIPSGLILRTNEALLGGTVSTLKYEVVNNALIPTGGTTVANVDIRRINFKIPVGSLTQHGVLPDASLVTTNVDSNYTEVGGIIYKYKANGEPANDASFCWTIRGFDGADALANEITIVKSTLPSPPSLTVTNLSSFYRYGNLRVTRTNPSGVLNLDPANYTFQTSNLKKYRLVSAVSFAGGEATKTVQIERVMDKHPNAAFSDFNYCANYADYNYAPSFYSPTYLQVLEGNAVLGMPISVTDNTSNTLLAKDLDDRYSLSLVSDGSTTPPVGPFMLCRNPAASVGSFSSGCTPCSDTTGYTHHQSRFCYLRYNPDALDVSKTFQFKVSVNDSGFSIPAGSNVRTVLLSINVKEINNAPYFTDGNWNPPGLGADQNTPIDLGTAVEGSFSKFQIFSMDMDATYDYKRLGYSLHTQVYDRKTSTWVPKPAGLTVRVENYVAFPNGLGAKTTGAIEWTPTDAEVKALSTSEGFVIKVQTYDAISEPAVRQSAYSYYLVKAVNRNNSPEILAIGTNNKFNIQADTYFTTTFQVRDKDLATPTGGSFVTSLTGCEDSNSNLLYYPGSSFDGNPVSPLYDCHASQLLWEDEVYNYLSNYSGNKGVGASACRSGAGEINLNESLALPKLTRISGPSISGGYIYYTYRLEWCPQTGQIGVHRPTIMVTDNGDLARSGDLSSRLSGTTPLELTVTSPVFWVSPRLDVSDQPEHFMVQTAAGLTANSFTYKTIVKNSLKNPLTYSIEVAPRSCALPNGVCINSSGVITWNPLVTDVTDPADPLTWHRIQVRVTDQVTGAYDTSFFFLQVQNPLMPTEAIPTLSRLPNVSVVYLDEREPFTFKAVGSDTNLNDQLFYRWYVDGTLVSDEGDEFAYRPGYLDGTVDPDGTGPLLIGQHRVTVEVTDGNYVATGSWIAQVLNTYPVPESSFSLVTARAPTVLTGVEWNAETSVHTRFGADDIDYLAFAGKYQVGPTVKNFAWSLQYVNGLLTTGSWNYYEDLAWGSANRTRNMSYKMTSATAFDLLLTPLVTRAGPYSATTDSVRLYGNYRTLPVPLANAQRCTGLCTKNHYNGDGDYGVLPRARLTNSGSIYLFFADLSLNKLFWDKNSGASTAFYTTTSKIQSLAVNTALARLYAVTRDEVTKTYNLLVFDIAPTFSGASPGAPIAVLNIFDGIPGHEDSLPSDMVVDQANSRVYIHLAGTGGIAKLQDSIAVPGPGDLTFVGVDEIEASPTDLPMSGARIAYNPNTGLIVGISRDGNQVYAIDTLNGMAIYKFPTSQKFDSVQLLADSGLILLVNRSGATVFKVR